jgi:hypothetical protein
LFQAVAAFGYRLQPSHVREDEWPPGSGHRYTITANAEGFRERRDLASPDVRPRVLVLGDSMVFGLGAEEPERVTERLEALAPEWRVDNLGMVGFGPDLMVRALEAVGVPLRPAVAVLVMFSHDVYRVVPEAIGAGYALPRFELRDGALVTVPYPERPWWMRTALVQGVRYGLFRYTSATWPLNEAILRRFQALAATHGFEPALVFVPGPRERFDDRARRAWLAAWSAEARLPFLDTTTALRETGTARAYLPADSHWSPDGHATVAAALRPFVAERIAAWRARQSSSN